MSKNQRNAATAPETIESITLRYEAEATAIEESIAEKARGKAKIVVALPSMSKQLYGTERYSTKTRNWFGDILWFAALLLVAAFEIPTNSGGFEIFNRTQTQTTGMAIAFGVITAILAHFTGYSFKRGVAANRHNQNSGAFFWGVLFFFVAVGMFWFIAGFRVAYMHKMGFKDEISQFTQAFFALGIFLVGAVASFFHTSGVKDLHLEKVFKTDLRTLGSLDKVLKRLSIKKKDLEKKYAADKAKAEKAIKDFNDRQKQDAQAEKQQEQENELQKKAEFKALQTKFDMLYSEAKSIYDSTPIKGILKSNVDFLTAHGAMEVTIEEMEKNSHEVPGANEVIQHAKNQFSQLNLNHLN
jgi:Skp family chaperone for outer membrane proteins